MGRRYAILIGIMLILFGLLALAFNLGAPILAPHLWEWGAWRLWPLVVVTVGLCLAAPPILVRGQRGLGALFIPATPILATGGILLYASVLNRWDDWAWLWPVEVLSVALGFGLAALFTRGIWLLLPAMLIGTNGLILQYCAITGEWGLWAVLWALEPLSIGLAFLIINVKQRSLGLLVAGLILCGVAAAGLIGMTAIFTRWALINALGPALLILVGLLTLISSLARKPAVAEAASE